MKLHTRLLMTSLALPALLALTACSNNAGTSNEGTDINTGIGGDPTLNVTAVKGPLTAGQQLFVSTQALRARSSAEITDANVVGNLVTNDKVEIQDPTEIGDQKFVAVKVIESKSKVPKDVVIYVPRQYLSEQNVVIWAADGRGTDITVITNIATQKVRVYKQCAPDEACKNKMIFEQDVVTGEDEDNKRTDVGSYRVESWLKFYETEAYPAWYKKDYPALPKIGSRSGWVGSDTMPLVPATDKDGKVIRGSDGKIKYTKKGVMRGAFGWYTAFVWPRNDGQWMHGTAGWGEDKKKFIEFRYTGLGQILDIFTSVNSHGCTRIDNESIAYLRTIVPIGARYLKVYAKEGLRDQTRAAYVDQKTPGRFDYILTTVGAQHWTHEIAERETVLKDGTPQNQWLDQGTLSVPMYPNPVVFTGRERGGDFYGIGKDQFTGVFLVDEGTFVGYQHPPASKKIQYGGFTEGGAPAPLPKANVSTDTNYFIPTK